MHKNIKTITNEIIQKYEELIEYEKKCIFPSAQFINYIYSLVFHEADFGQEYQECLYNLHYSLIERCVNESFNCIKFAKESEYLNLFNNQIKKINYKIYYLNKAFIYLERCYILTKNKDSLIKQTFKIFKNKFLVPVQDNLFRVLINYLLNNNNLENKENCSTIKKIFNFMNVVEISEPKIIKIKNEIIWENDGNNLSETENNMFDNWFNNYFLKEISSYYHKKSIEFENLSITELISSILNVKDHLNSLKNYFDRDYYNKISLIFDENFINNNKEKIENYILNLDKNNFKQFYEINKNSKSCLNLICSFLIYSIQNNGFKIFENKGIQFNLKEENICIPIEIKKDLEKFIY